MPNAAALRFFITCVLGVFSVTSRAIPVDVFGGSISNPTDITTRLLLNQDLNFLGGNFVVSLPQSGTGLVTAQSVDAYLVRYGNNGFSSVANPTIRYTGVISGNGSLVVRSAFNSQRPDYGQPFSGGVLVFANQSGQTWGLDGVASGGHNPPALKIESNATVEFFFPGSVDNSAGASPLGNAFDGSSATKGRNVVNDGYLYVSAQNSWGSIIGTGVNVFQFWGGDRGNFTSEGVYSAQTFIFNSGLKVNRGATFEPQPDGQPTTQVSSDITVFQNTSSQWLTLPASYKIGDPVNLMPQNIYMFALNIQLWGSGIHQFTGMLLPPTGSKNHLELASATEAARGLYYYGGGSNQAFGRVINLTSRATLLMGDGREIITNSDGVSNNTFLQGNPFNSMLSTNNFVKEPDGPRAQSLAYNYSGTYRLNTNFNAKVDAANGIVIGGRNTGWVNLFIVDPKPWNSASQLPNHAILTVPVFFEGLTQIDQNAILQIGDGTTGNDVIGKTLTVNGVTQTSRYNDSMGNGMLMTRGNYSALSGDVAPNPAVNFAIVNNGRLLVNNTPGALSATSAGASPSVIAWVNANQLDGISGGGSVEQQGALALTLGALKGNPNTYTGGTRIKPGSTLIAGSPTAFGQRSRAALTSSANGRVVNNGTLRAAIGVRVINVPGDYVQAIIP